ncbi:MAG: TolC family protein [Bacteroidales bacterium]|nr:TolC family protein [Bacteroidales bacterium]MCF8390160.1 TolC family protein [Bacteroidales bacterium]
MLKQKIIPQKRELLKFFLILIFLLHNYDSQGQIWSLQQCIDTAQIHNKNLQISRNMVAIGEQKQKEAKANLIPKLSMEADYKYFTDLPYQLMPQSAFGGPEGLFKETQFGVPHNINANIKIAMPIYNPQINGAIQSTKIASELSEFQYKKTEEQVFFEISNLYYNAQIFQHQLAFVDSNRANTKKLLDNMQLMFSQQLVTGTDVGKIQLQYDQLMTHHALIASNIEQIMNTLKFSIGIPFNKKIEIESAIIYQESKKYSNALIVDLEIANLQNRMLTNDLNTLKNSRLPSVFLYGSYGQTGFGYDEKPNDFLNFYPNSFAGIQLSYPLFNGTVTKKKINQKKIEIQNSNLQVQIVEEQNNMLIENAVRKRTLTQQTISNCLSQVDIASALYEQSVLQHKEGTATITDILIADSVLREAQQSYLSAVIDYLKADLELKKLTGNISNRN